MPEYQAVVTMWVTADDKDHAAVMIGEQVPVAHRVERVLELVSAPGPDDEEIRLLARAYEALSAARPAWRVLPVDQADRLASQLVDDFTAAHGPPESAQAMAAFTQAWVRSRYG
jgi:hypothetical protein